MKKLSILFLTLFSITCFAQENKVSHTEEIQAFQDDLNDHYADKKTSPLEKKDLRKFKKLAFFPIDKALKITADFERTPNEPTFEMQTSTERLPLYAQYGIATFTIDGKKLSLRIYKSQSLVLDPEYADYLFLPYNDLTNGNETYGAGRYVDLSIDDINDVTIVIDFNKSYNPYCAYSHRYSCPIPPRENDLDVEIKAGVLSFDKH